MSGLLSVLAGSAARTPRAPRIPRPLAVALAVAVITFYLANAYGSPLSAFLLQGKWLPLAVLTLVGLTMLRDRPAPRLPMTMLIPLSAMFLVAGAGIRGSIDPAYSLMSWITICGSIVCGYVVSAMVVATDSRRAYFELLARVGRIFVVVTALMAILGLNLGRGTGLSAWSDNPNTLAAILSPAMIIFVAGCLERRPGWIVWHAPFFLLTFALVWATGARSSIVWLGLSLAAFWLYRRGPGVVVFGVILALIVGIGWWFPIKEFLIETLGLRWEVRMGGVSPLSGREEVWRIGWQLFWERPITGYGLGSSQDVIRGEAWKFVKHQGLHFHSSYLMAAVEMGIFGFFAFIAVLLTTLVRAISDSARTAVLPRESWPLAALPFALVFGAMGHALFESWLLASGNANMMLFWTWVWMIYHQAQVKVRAVTVSEPERTTPGAALPARSSAALPAR